MRGVLSTRALLARSVVFIPRTTVTTLSTPLVMTLPPHFLCWSLRLRPTWNSVLSLRVTCVLFFLIGFRLSVAVPLPIRVSLGVLGPVQRSSGRQLNPITENHSTSQTSKSKNLDAKVYSCMVLWSGRSCCSSCFPSWSSRFWNIVFLVDHNTHTCMCAVYMYLTV